MRRTAILPALSLLLGLFGTVTPVAHAKTTLDVEIGWGGTLRAGRWVPIFVTASHDRPREVRLELEVAQGGPYVLRLSQYLTIGPQPMTVVLYAPVRETWGDPPAVTLRDAGTGKSLARWPGDDPAATRQNRVFDKLVQGNLKFVGVAGPRGGRLDHMQNDVGSEVFNWDDLSTDLLPDAPVGYDLLDLLVLQRVDLNQVDRSRQQAIADWVRGGGCVLVIPSAEPTPADGPLADVLPCRVGQPTEYLFPDDLRKPLETTGRRSTGVSGFALTPRPGAGALQLWPDVDGRPGARAYAADVGFGRIVVCPFDVTALDFGGGEGPGRQLYRTLLGGTGLTPAVDPPSDGTTTGGYSYGLDPMTRRQDQATSTLQDHLGSVPGAGRFGFSYVAWVVLGMMVLVGPVDWFVLKRLNRQPWTWVTTAGWVGTVTVGALYAGHVFKSGDLHYRTVALIDQADDRVVARTTLAGLYSPKTTIYHLDAAPTETDAQGKPVPTRRPPGGWWDPASTNAYGGGGLKVDVPFHQTTEGNLPEPLAVNVWNLRFLRGEDLAAGDPMIRASLRLTDTAGVEATRLVGSITNVSDVALTNVRVQVPDPHGRVKAAAPAVPATPPSDESNVSPDVPTPQEAAAAWDAEAARFAVINSPIVAARLAPGETVKVDVAPAARTPAGANGSPASPPAGVVSRQRHDGSVPAAESVWTMAADLSGRRGTRSELAMGSGRHAVVYATVADAKPAAVLREPGAKERHEAVLRALVRLEPRSGKVDK